MASASAKYVASLACALNQRSYFARFIDAFFAIPVGMQRDLIEHICVENSSDSFIQHSQDQTEWPEFVRAVLIHYSGNEEKGQPTKRDLARIIGEFYKTGKADESLENKPEEFMEALEDI